MAGKYSDEELNKLIYQTIVPKGLRPTKLDDIDTMLDVIGGETPSEDTVQRMLRKIHGQEPIGIRPEVDELHENIAADIPESEMALYRNRNAKIPPEIQQKLKEIEERAKNKKDRLDKENDE